MSIKERLQRTVTITVLQRQSMIIVTLLSTLCLAKIWPRFHDDAMSVGWYVYLALIAVFSIPLFSKRKHGQGDS